MKVTFTRVLIATLLFCGSAVAQTPVYQSGTVTPGDPAVWTSQRFIGDGAQNGGFSNILVTSTTPTLCANSALVTGSYYQLCLGALNAAGTGGTLLYSANNGASTLPFIIAVNGGAIDINGNAIGIGGSYGAQYGPLLSGGGINGTMTFGTRSGNTTAFLTQDSATPTSGHCPQYDAFGGFIDSGASCASSGVGAGVAGNLAWYQTSGSSVVGNVNLNVTNAAFTIGVAGSTQGSLGLSGAGAGTFTQAVPSSVTSYTLTWPSAEPASGQSLVATNGTGSTKWGFPAPVCCTNETTSFNAAAFVMYTVDTSGGAVTLTLPASPNGGDRICWIDAKNNFAVNNLTVAVNGNKFANISANLLVNITNGSFCSAWDSTNSTWNLSPS